MLGSTRAARASSSTSGRRSSARSASDGYPKPIFDKATGVIDRSVAAYWKEHYDLHRILQRDWATLGPKLQGKLHIYVGSADTYFLNNAVYYLEDFLKTTKNPSTTAKCNTAIARSTAGTAIRLCRTPLAPALQHDVPAEDPGAHQEDRAGRRRSEVLAVLTGRPGEAPTARRRGPDAIRPRIGPLRHAVRPRIRPAADCAARRRSVTMKVPFLDTVSRSRAR